MPRQSIPEVLVGYENSDDAGVFQLTADIALVQTVAYFSPIVDDAYTYGQIAAANSLSDVYAMGGDPKTALSIVGFPTSGLDFSILGDIMRGGLDKLNEAGVALLGGHSVRDDEIKFGYAVTGIVEKKNIKQNSGAREGNRLRVRATKFASIPRRVTAGIREEARDLGRFLGSPDVDIQIA